MMVVFTTTCSESVLQDNSNQYRVEKNKGGSNPLFFFAPKKMDEMDGMDDMDDMDWMDNGQYQTFSWRACHMRWKPGQLARSSSRVPSATFIPFSR